ncbi:MAG: MOFRL family protein, partial [Rhodobacteraceae bacterium]
AAEALARADSGTWLAGRDALLVSGPTGTNVMDLLIAVKSTA